MSDSSGVPPPGSNDKPNYFLPVALVTSLFFCWGLTNNLLPVLIPKLKAACELSNTQSMYVDVANWSAYFLMALPTALIMRKFGYKAGIIAGLLTAAAGCFLFIPAAKLAIFPLFLTALFITASGMVFLETAANPYISVLGDPKKAAFRLNLSQSFNGLAAVIAALWLSKIIIKPDDKEALLKLIPADHLSDVMAKLQTIPIQEHVKFIQEQIHTLAPVVHKQYLLDQAAMVIPPYVVIGGFLLLLAVVFYFIKLPEIKGETPKEDAKSFNITHHPLLLMGVITLFFYVGAQVGVDATFLNYTHEVTGLTMYDATTYLGLILGCFFIGRVAGTAMMSVISAPVLLGVFALGIMILLSMCATVSTDVSASCKVVDVPSWLGLGDKLVFTSHVAPYYFMGVKFFMSIMFPTIFSLALRGLGEYTKIGSSFLVMSIVGGALIPLVMGRIADQTHSFKPALWVLVVCMIPVVIFAVMSYKADKKI